MFADPTITSPVDTFWVYVHLKKPNVTKSFIILPLFLPLRVLHHCHLHGYQQLYVRIILSELKEMQKKRFLQEKGINYPDFGSIIILCKINL